MTHAHGQSDNEEEAFRRRLGNKHYSRESGLALGVPPHSERVARWRSSQAP